MKRVLALALSLVLSLSVLGTFASETKVVSYPDFLFENPGAVEVTELSYGSAGTNINGVNVKNVKAVLLDGAKYNGIETQVFAYWGMPDNIKEGEKVPGVVLVHGGNGVAYADWVQRWNDRGYAAIAVYWIESNDPAVPASYNWTKGPRHLGTFDDINEAVENQWMYHAVSTAIVGNSFLRNQANVDANKVGICGVSWGGIITSYATGVDNRFAFAVPIYGAGYIKDSYAYIGSKITTEKQLWDPATVLKNSTVPTLFVNGDSDPWFSLNLQASSSKDVAGSRISVINGLEHGHQLAFAVEEPYSFADSIVKNGTEFTTVKSNEYFEENNEVKGSVKYQTVSSISKATLYYTKNGLVYEGETTFKYPWYSKSITVGNGEVNFTLPLGTVGYYVALKDEMGRIVSTPYVELPDELIKEEPKVEEPEKDNTKVIMTWDGEDSIPNLGGQDLSNVLDVVEFDGEKVINLNTNLASVPVSGRAINYWTLTENKNLNKRLSFQVYVPSSSYYYVDMRLSSARHTVETIQSNQLNNISQFTLATDASNGRFIFGVCDGAGAAITTKGIAGLDMWHNVDIYIKDKKVSYFVDYEHVADTNVIASGVYVDGFNHAFKGFQMCVGQDGGTTGEEEGMYIRNITLSEVDTGFGSLILDDGFENYAVDTEISDGIDVQDITSAISSSSRYNNFVTISGAWSATGAMGFKELAGGNKVFVARNVPDHPRVGSGKDLRFGFWRSNPVDLSRGDITIEFDINIPDRNKIWYLIVQPFAHNDSIGVLENQINVGGVPTGGNTGSAKTAYASLVTPNKTAGSLFNLRKDGQIYFGGNIDGNGSFYHSPAYKEGEWANVRFVISKVGEGSYRTKVYLNNGLIGEQSTAATVANAAQTQITDMVRGVRFISVLDATANPVTDLYYIDNLKMYLNDGVPTTTYDVETFKVTDNFGNVIGNTVDANATSVEAGVIITKNKAMSENLQVILAQYDENGVLTDCGLKEVGTKDAAIGSHLGGMVKENLSSTTKRVKAFLWTAQSLRPIESKTMSK